MNCYAYSIYKTPQCVVACVTNGNILHFQSLFNPDYLGSRRISGKKIKEDRNNGVRHNMLRRSMAVLKCYACRSCLLPCASPVTLRSVHTKFVSADKDKECATDKRLGLLAVGQNVGPMRFPFRPCCFQIYFDGGCVTS